MKLVVCLFLLAGCGSSGVGAPTDGGIDHDAWWPIGPGTQHDDPCAACHTNPADDTAYDCMSGGCHPQSEADTQHTTVVGYSYGSSVKCLACHSF